MVNQKEARKLWIDALRSGKYKQTRGWLHNQNGYCCLGVACEMYQAEVGDLVVTNNCGATLYNDHRAFLPTRVQKWLGLIGRDGSFVGDSKLYSSERSLANENDRGRSLAQIADLIESEVDGLIVPD